MGHRDQPWYVLTRHFFRALFDFGVLSDTGTEAFKRLLLGLAAAALALGLLLVRIFATKYAILAELQAHEAYALALVSDHAFLMAIQGSSIDLAAEILTAGADPNLPDQNGYTPLSELAAFCDETGLVSAVIEAGGNVKAKARNGKTPLGVARDTGCTEIARLLRKAGAVQ